MSPELIASKTLRETINGLEPSQELMQKALTIGQTKVMDGITYVVKETPSGLGWRVLYKKRKKKIKLKNGKTIKANDLFDNSHFPDLDDIEVVEKLQNSSTGAELVKDKQTGKLFVKKSGTSPDHVREEFLANSIYKVFDVIVPEMKLYDENSTFILSEYIEDSTPVNEVIDDLYREDMMEDYVVDCLIGNWDIYKNDNIRVDNNTGQIVRVDNGGSLRFSAQGRDKSKYFFDDVDEIETMMKNNPEFEEFFDDKKLKSQIRYVVKHRNEVLSLIDDPSLRKKMSSRFDDLEDRISKADDDPYRKLKERELRQALENSHGHITHTGENGWTFLSEICKLRGFDSEPTVVESKAFDKLLKKQNNLLIHRGLTGQNGRSAKEYMKDFAYGEECFYGTQAMYGAGIYAAVNKTKQITDPPNEDLDIAMQYSGYQKEHILDIIVPDDVKIIDAYELDKMMNEEFFGDDFKEKKIEYDEEVDKLNKFLIEKEEKEKLISESVKQNMGWNEKTWMYLRRSKPEEVYHDPSGKGFEKTIKYFSALVSSINGKINKIDDDNYEVSLPNYSGTHLINRNVANRAIKQKNENSTKYNYHYKTLKDFIHKNHFGLIQNEVKKKIDKETRENQGLKDLSENIKNQQQKIQVISDEINTLKNTGSATVNEVIATIAKHPSGTHRGFYAAIKGYDMIIQKNGWGGNTDFAVILNRSKMIVRKFD